MNPRSITPSGATSGLSASAPLENTGRPAARGTRSGDWLPRLMRNAAITCVASLSVFGIGGCQTAGPGRFAPTQADRLMNAYPELRSGRFALIADFEDAKQMGLFQTISVSDEAKCVLSSSGGRKATGTPSLAFTAASKDDTVIIANQGRDDWYLKRDWRAYDLLMMSVHSPQDALSLDVAIAGAAARDRTTVFTTVPLDRGWNVLRLDLGEVGEGVPLDDVREIRLNVQGLTHSATLHIDDIVLTGFRKAIFGDPDNTDGDLYVQQVGRRLRIGAGGQFELTVANGQVRGWHNLADDPHRLRNLLYESTLGPNPAVIGGDQGAGGFSGLGKTVVATHRVVEANTVRVVLACEWRFVSDRARARGGLDAMPFQRWRYTIYPTGQIYVSIESTSKTKKGWSPQLGLSVTLTSPTPGGIRTFIPHMQSDKAGEGEVMFATLSNESARAELLVVANLSGTTTRFVETVSADRRSVSILAVDGRNDTPIKAWVSHLYVRGGEGSSTEAFRARAIDVLGIDSQVRIERGSPADLSKDVVRADGFDTGSGCYAVVPDAGRVRIVVEGNKRPVFSPVFCIPASTSQEAWVYVDHLAFEPVVTSAGGLLLFQLPGRVDQRRVVEVLFRRPAPKPTP